MYLAALLTLAVKEDAAIYLIVFALYLIASKKSSRHGIIMLGMALVYFLMATSILENRGLGIMSYRYGNLILNTDDGLAGAVKTLLLNPGYILTQLFSTTASDYHKLVYLLELLLPLGCMPLCSKKPSRWLLLTPLLLNLLTMYVYQYEISFQYSFGITAFLFYATVQNVADMTPTARKTLITLAFAFGICLYTVTVLPECSRYLSASRDNADRYDRMEEILAMIPEDASVCSSTFLLPHIADRREIYEVDSHDGKCDIDYVVLDARYASHQAYKEHYINQGYQEFFYEEGLILILISPAGEAP